MDYVYSTQLHFFKQKASQSPEQESELSSSASSTVPSDEDQDHGVIIKEGLGLPQIPEAVEEEDSASPVQGGPAQNFADKHRQEVLQSLELRGVEVYQSFTAKIEVRG